MKILYFDCSSGVSGDMILGALMDAGLDPDVLKKGIRALNFKGASLEIKGEKRNGIKGTRVIVHTPKEKKTRGLRDILGLLDKGTLPSPVKTHAKAIFQLLAQVEAKVHCISIEKVHFHELGALDTIIDIVGACLAVHALKIKRIYTSALPLGSGKVKTRHGLLPVPAPAVVELLRGIPVYRDDADTELVTPTGAVIMKYFLKGNVGEMPQMMIDHVGYGVGAKHLKDRTNLLRVFIGTLAAQTDMQMDKVHVLETQIDDMSPELFGKLFENLLSIGALDANWIPVHMKNNRPGFQLQVIVKKGDSEKIADFIFKNPPRSESA